MLLFSFISTDDVFFCTRIVYPKVKMTFGYFDDSGDLFFLFWFALTQGLIWRRGEGVDKKKVFSILCFIQG